MLEGSFTWVKYILGIKCHDFYFRLNMEDVMALRKIVIHWTAGTYQPNGVDYLHYHYLINGDGIVVKGKYDPKDNENCNDGKYAQHTGGGNTGAIGVALCGMCGYKSINDVGRYPLRRKQCESMFVYVAKLCKSYNIPITAQTVFTHYEFGLSHPNTSSAGKIDIVYLPPFPDIAKDKIGDFIRNKIRWYYSKL